MKLNKRLSSAIIFLIVGLSNGFSETNSSPKAIGAIRETDLKKDLYEMASDRFLGREAGTLDELKSAAWLAEKAKAAGLQPAGDDGTFFQYFPLIRRKILSNSLIKIG